MCTGKDTEWKLQKACKKREKWRGKNRVPVVSVGENVDSSGFRDDGWGLGGKFSGLGKEWKRAGSPVFCLWSFVLKERKGKEIDTPSGGS